MFVIEDFLLSIPTINSNIMNDFLYYPNANYAKFYTEWLDYMSHEQALVLKYFSLVKLENINVPDVIVVIEFLKSYDWDRNDPTEVEIHKLFIYMQYYMSCMATIQGELFRRLGGKPAAVSIDLMTGNYSTDV